MKSARRGSLHVYANAGEAQPVLDVAASMSVEQNAISLGTMLQMVRKRFVLLGSQRCAGSRSVLLNLFSSQYMTYKR